MQHPSITESGFLPHPMAPQSPPYLTLTLTLRPCVPQVIIYDLLAIPGPSPFSFPLQNLIFIGSPVRLFVALLSTHS